MALSFRANTTVTLTAPGGAQLVETVSAGTFAASLPAQTVFQATANVTMLVTGTNGSFYETYSSVPGSTCTTGTTSAQCMSTVSGVPNPVWLNGTLSTPGQSGSLAGTVRIVGPVPQHQRHRRRDLERHLLGPRPPGAYSLYATAGGGASRWRPSPVRSPSRTSRRSGSRSLRPGASSLRITGPNGTIGGLGPGMVALRDARLRPRRHSVVAMGARPGRPGPSGSIPCERSPTAPRTGS